MSRIEDLPDFPAIREIANALWRVGDARGAAVMVGAGFSRFARLPSADSPMPPLWNDFRRRMMEEVRPAATGDSGPDALRLAEEYRSEFGQPRMEGLVRELVRDDRWMPGEHHERLVRLPWTDMLTTNWDTLLERAAAGDPELEFEPVLVEGDIARTRSPRIVKLHGTFPLLKPFVLTEEDFRTYPTRHAPFVNLAQQVLLENEMCLLGFSGDDPNFLAWSGWVRDHLGTAARRVRLVGVLDLAPSQRRMLEARNVSVVDLAPLVCDLDPADRHSAAMSSFIGALEAAKPSAPWSWKALDERQPEGASFRDVAELWRAERRAYPGWLVAPDHHREHVRRRTFEALRQAGETLPAAPRSDVARALVELAWRCEVALFDLPSDLMEVAQDLLHDAAAPLSRAERVALGLCLARARRAARDREGFERAVGGASLHVTDPEHYASIAFERALFARDELDHAGVEAVLDRIEADDPIWLARRASLLVDLGREAEAIGLLRRALAEVRSRRARDRSSVWLLSREAWLRFNLRLAWFSMEDEDELTFLDEWPARFADAKCDPWRELQNWDVELEEARQAQEKRSVTSQVLYDPGMRQRFEHGRTWTASFVVSPYDELRSLLDRTGVAVFRHDGTIGTRLERAALLLEGDDAQAVWRRVMALRGKEGGLMDARFDRLSVACLPMDLVVGLATALRRSIDVGRVRLWAPSRRAGEDRRLTSWAETVLRRMELLSRLAVRLDVGSAECLLAWGFEVAAARDWDHWWLFEPTSNLLERAFSAVPPDQRANFAGAILHLPLAEENARNAMPDRWPELAESLLPHAASMRRPPSAWDRRIADLIALVRSGERRMRTAAVLRLLPFRVARLLTEDEQAGLSQAIWSRTGDGALPSEIDLSSHVFLELPEPQPGMAEAAFRRDVVGRLVAGRQLQGDWHALSEACRQRRRLVLSVDEAAALLDVVLRTAESEAFRRGSDPEESRMALALSFGILPLLTKERLSATLADRLLRACELSSGLLMALPKLAAIAPASTDRVLRQVRRGISSRDPQVAEYALFAVRRWSELEREGAATLPRSIVNDVVYLVITRRGAGLRAALETAARLVQDGVTADEDLTSLDDALEPLLVETTYDYADPGAVPADQRSLVRRECVRLAVELNRRGGGAASTEWMAAASSDALPEVRFALEAASGARD